MCLKIDLAAVKQLECQEVVVQVILEGRAARELSLRSKESGGGGLTLLTEKKGRDNEVLEARHNMWIFRAGKKEQGLALPPTRVNKHKEVWKSADMWTLMLSKKSSRRRQVNCV
jgi:hypothetical protein